MAGFKITRFMGRMPKVSNELLPDTAAQVATNCKLYSGDLVPFPEPLNTGGAIRTGGVKTIYAMRNPDTSALVWLSWAERVDIATPSIVEDREQRIYYTGDGYPRATNYALASAGTGPYPTAAFRLGIPIPETKLTTVASASPSVAISTIARTANQTTVVTSAPHGLVTDSTITITGVQNLTGTYTQSTTTVTCSITAHGLSVGDSVTCLFTQLSTGERPASGTYQITGVTTNTFTVTVGNSDTDNGTVVVLMSSFNVNNVLATVVDSTTVTFPNIGFALATKSITGAKINLTSTPIPRTYIYTWVGDWDNAEGIGSEPSVEVVVREGQVVTVSDLPTAPPPGNYNIRGIRLYRSLTGTTRADYVRLKTLWFPTRIETISRTDNVVTVTTTQRHKLEKDDRIKIDDMTSSASYEGEGFVVTSVNDDYTFEFEQVTTDLAEATETTGKIYYDASQREESAEVYFTNSTFVDNFDARLLFSSYESDNYSPPPENLQGLTAINDGMLAGFVGNLLYLSIPGEPHAWPEEYAITLEHPIIGLAAVAGSTLVLTEGYPYLVTGSSPEVMSVTRVDTLYPCLSRAGIVSMKYGIVYPTHNGLAVFSGAGGIQLITQTTFETDTWKGNIAPTTIVAKCYRDQYFASHYGGSFTFDFDPQTGGSFVDCVQRFDACHYDTLTNNFYYALGTDGTIYQWDNTTQAALTQQWKSKVMVSQDYINLGAARVMADFDGVNNVTFRMYVDKVLKFTRTVTDNKPFRLPTGYRTDTYEFEVITKLRVRSIHVAETMTGLKQV